MRVLEFLYDYDCGYNSPLAVIVKLVNEELDFRIHDNGNLDVQEFCNLSIRQVIDGLNCIDLEGMFDPFYL